jgi:signal transduction histidine kinase
VSSPEPEAPARAIAPRGGGTAAVEEMPAAEAPTTEEGLSRFEPGFVTQIEAGDRPSGRIKIDLKAFHEELRRANLPLLFWTVMVFNIAYLAWGVFDYVLIPEQWRYFVTLRIVAAVLNNLVLFAVSRQRLRRYTWEAFWIVGLIFGGFIAPMLPLVGDSWFAYIMGFSIVIFGAGLLPFWPPRWTVTVVAALIGTALAAFLIWPSTISHRDVLGGVFFVATAVGLSIASVSFRYDLGRRDYLTRSELYALARREADARLRLARASDDLQDALEKLKELDRLKSKFFANVSHELRTPLTLILAPVEELTQATTDRNQLQYLRVVRKNAHRLLRLIDDLLDLSRLDAGGLRLNLAEIDMRAIAATVHENSKPAAMAKGVEFTLLAEPSPRRIFGDAHRLEIVLTNLVGNAIKFTPSGGRIDLRVEDLPAGVRVAVSDSGHGIPADALPHVFERFFQASPADQRREGGVGIGLALAKELVELHGGSVTAESQLNAGSTFSFFIPFGKEHIRPEVVERRREFTPREDFRRRTEDPESAPRPAVAARVAEPDQPEAPVEPVLFSGSRRARVVLAEDHGDVREFIRGLLEPEFELLTAADGDEAWELVCRELPDLVISDVMMPGRTGTELCRDIKAEPALKNIPVILLTARVGSEATLEGYAHGADDFVAKPFHPRVLLARVRAQLKLRALGLQLAEREKLAVVGTLAAGILHEVRNPVNAILNAARVLANGKSNNEMANKLISVIGDAAERIQGITAALETHARPAERGGFTPCDVRAGLDATVRLLEHRMEGVTVHREYTTDAKAAAPPGPLNQVFLNILDNALRAGARNLWLRVAEQEQKLMVRIGDDGPGVPPAVAQRIFDPFFTTREAGAGVGLGLFLSRRIVESHHGTLWIEDRQGGGAEFVIELPAVWRKQRA